MTALHATIDQGVHITEECELGQIQFLLPTTFEDYLHTHCAEGKWVYQNISFGEHLQVIVGSLQHGNLQAVYDGLFDNHYDSATWCIDGDGSIIRGVNLVPAGSDTLDAARCELAGIYTILRINE